MSAEPDSIPDGWAETMDENGWTDEEKRAWEVLHDAREGDYVLWADRSLAMEVIDREQDEEGHHVLKVDKPRGEGHYEVHERYDDGNPKFTSGIGSANNLHFVERTDRPRGLEEDEYEELVARQSENAADNFRRYDYGSWSDAVEEQTGIWQDDVSFEDWVGYKHHPDWEDGDAEAIYESVLEHSTYEGYDDSLPLPEKATAALYNDVFQEGRTVAEESIIASESDYWDTVEKLAHHSIDRYDRKSYSSARVAVRDTISDWIDDRQEPALRSVIQHGTQRFDDADEVYAEEQNPERELAFDILDHDVWEEVQELNRERGDHDPTIRGLTYSDYHELVDYLVGRTLQSYNGKGFLRTTVANVVDLWTYDVQQRQWEGHRHRVYAAGDVEDIFMSVVVHSDSDPFVWNPFAGDRERRLAKNALVSDVTEAASRAIDEQDSEPAVPADDYLQNNLGMEDMTYHELQEVEDRELDEFLSNVVDAVEGDEVGWTFVDEVIEFGGVVPEMTNDWMLVDYGIVREGSDLRKLAWFNRETGDVLVLSGTISYEGGGPDEEESGATVGDFHVTHHEFRADEPEFLLTDADIEEALQYVYDYLDADRADFRVIETREDAWVMDAIGDDDINAGGMLDALIPNMVLGSDDITALAGSSAEGAGKWLRFWWPEVKGVTAFAVMSLAPGFVGKALDGVRFEPSIHKKHGVGVNISKEFGEAPYGSGIGGKANVNVNVRPGTFRRLSERYAPKFMRYGFDEGDVGKGAVRAAGEGLEGVRGNQWGKAFLKTFGGSVETLEAALKGGMTQSQQEQMARQHLASERGVPESDVPDEDARKWLKGVFDENDSGPGWMDRAPDGLFFDADSDEEFREHIQSQGFSWDDFENSNLGISAMLLRGLDAKAVTKGAKFFAVDKWLKDNFTFYGSDFVTSEPPTFEEWQEERYGPGRPGGPREEARRLARFHKEVAAGKDSPDPVEALGYDEDDLGDFDLSQYTDEFGNDFEEVADRFREDEPAEPREEFEDGHE